MLHRYENGSDCSDSDSDGDDCELCDSYDYVAVFPVKEDGEMQSAAKFFMGKVESIGLETFCYLSVQKNELFVLLRCPLPKLRVFADAINYRLELNPRVTRTMCEAGFPESNIAPIDIADDNKYSSIPPYKYIYGKFDSALPEELYQHTKSIDHPFKRSVRLKLIYYMLQAPSHQGGGGLKLEKMLAKNKVLAMYPMHNSRKLKRLADSWVNGCNAPWKLPINVIKEYFGEKVALYFVFMSSYTRALIIPGIVGLVFQIIVWQSGNWSHPVLPFFSVLINVWVIFFLEMWKRKQSQHAMEWGTSNFEEEEPDRPDFDGDTIKSFINGQEVLYFPPQQRSFLLCQSTCVINTFITLVIGFVAAIYILRFRLYSSIGGNASIVASCLNSVQIVIFNMIYNWVAYKLTVRENHRTATSFDDSMIAKLFVFQFVNSYASFYFLAFIAPYVARPPQLDDDGPEGDYVGECGNADCMVPLSTNLGIIFLMNLTVNNLMEILQPYLSHRKKITAEIAGTVAAENVKKNHQGIQEAAKIMTPPELQYLLEEYDVSMCILKEYAETAVQFGLMTVFVSALPISPFVAMIYNFVEIKVDTWKLLNLYQRPIPKIAEDWGAWQEVFTVIAVISVITNAGLVCFTMQTLDHFKLSTRIWVFVGYQWSCFSLMYLCSILIPDKSAEVRIQEQRSEFIISKVIDRVPDEGDEEMNFILDSPTTSTRTTLHDGESTSTKVAINVQTYPFKVSSANDTADAEDVQLTKVSEEER